MPDRPVLTLAHSPDADDLVMWWPLTGLDAGGTPAIDTGRFVFRCVADDVQRLNRRAIEQSDLDITAISAAAWPHVSARYAITSSGGSFGEGYGPKLVIRVGAGTDLRVATATEGPGATRSSPRDAGPEESSTKVRVAPGALPWDAGPEALRRSGSRAHGNPSRSAKLRIAVPGRNTTAFLVLSLMLGPASFESTELLFSEIPQAVARGEFDAGLLIHEAQLTFESLGLVAVADLGVWWRDATRLPLPLGLNVIRRDLDERFGPGTCRDASRILAASIRHAVENPERSRAFLLSRSDDRPEWRDRALLDRYLRMYVSNLTLDMGDRGRQALRRLYTDAHAAGLCPDPGPIDTV